MVCPFIGTAFGGFLYDLLIFTGESPINTPWIGVKRIVRPNRKSQKTVAAGNPVKQV
jgi:aquaglyceroporin related protein, other eukaryote